MFPFSRSITIRRGPVSITFPRLPDLTARNALILLPWLRGFFYNISKHRISGRMRVIIRKRPVGLVMEIRLPGHKFKFHPYNTIFDCVRIINDWLRINPEFIR